MVGPDAAVRRSNDDGEPAGTAGRPILDALVHSGVSDVVAVVTRYFGGIKLGTGGLARAYAGAVSAALQTAPRVERISVRHYYLRVSHADAGRIEHALRTDGFTITDIAYEHEVRIALAVPADADLLTRLRTADIGSEGLTETGAGWHDSHKPPR